MRKLAALTVAFSLFAAPQAFAGIGSALSTAVSGLDADQSAIDVIGNNLANISTTSYKEFRNEFVTNFFSTMSLDSTNSAMMSEANPVTTSEATLSAAKSSVVNEENAVTAGEPKPLTTGEALSAEKPAAMHKAKPATLSEAKPAAMRETKPVPSHPVPHVHHR